MRAELERIFGVSARARGRAGGRGVKIVSAAEYAAHCTAAARRLARAGRRRRRRLPEILRDVRARGDAALVECTRALRRRALRHLETARGDSDARRRACARLARGRRRRCETAQGADRAFSRAPALRPILPTPKRMERGTALVHASARIDRRVRAGGQRASAVLTSVVPAKIAGVSASSCWRADADGRVHPAVLFACRSVRRRRTLRGRRRASDRGRGLRNRIDRRRRKDRRPGRRVGDRSQAPSFRAVRHRYARRPVRGAGRRRRRREQRVRRGRVARPGRGAIRAHASRWFPSRARCSMRSRSWSTRWTCKTLARGETISERHRTQLSPGRTRQRATRIFDVVDRFAPAALVAAGARCGPYLPRMRRAGFGLRRRSDAGRLRGRPGRHEHVLPTSGTARFSSALTLADFHARASPWSRTAPNGWNGDARRCRRAGRTRRIAPTRADRADAVRGA